MAEGKIRVWAREHKKGLIIAGCAVLAVGTGIVMVKAGHTKFLKGAGKAIANHLYPNERFKVIKGIRIEAPFAEGGCVNNFIQNVKISQMGELGKALNEAYIGLPKDVYADMLVSLYEK